MSASTQHKLDRVRPPRVQITYDVEVGGAIEMKELPFVGGILSDLSGKRDPDVPMAPMRDRKFVMIDRDNFNEVLASTGPRLAFPVANHMGEEGRMNVALNFEHMDDFSPISVVNQVPALNELYEERQRLSDLIAKLDGNDKLNALLRDVVADTSSLEQIKEGSADGAPEPPPEGEPEDAPAE